MGSLNLDEGGAVGMTMLVAHSAWGIVTPEICGARFRQGTAGEGWRDGIWSLWWQRGAGCAALSPYESPWRDASVFALAQLLDHGQVKGRSSIRPTRFYCGLAGKANQGTWRHW